MLAGVYDEEDSRDFPSWKKDEEEEDEIVCVMCDRSAARLYKIGADSLCGGCWNEYCN